jgi:CRISPR system Cascade subunit CasA
MEEREFNLCHEPWIFVLTKDYRMEMVNLSEALTRAHEFRYLAGETETQNIAVLRFLLAVLHSVFDRKNEAGEVGPIDSKKEALRRWQALWKKGRFPEAPIKEYLSQWEDRFWLFDAEYPFYQVATITGTNNPAKKMNGALVESNNKIQLFSLRNGDLKNQLEYDEAARWLIYLQAFDDTAAKNPSPKLCHLGNLGIVFARGNTLFETLMLNFVLLKNGKELFEEPSPVWERDNPYTQKLQQLQVPDNQAELFTLQCRRVRLQRTEDKITGYLESAGEYIDEESDFSEQMTYWKKTVEKNVEKIKPKMHDKTRQMWRDFSVLLPEDNSAHKPGIVSWIGKLSNAKLLARDRFVKLQITGVEYGNMCCGIADDFSDSLSMYASLLDDVGKICQEHIRMEVTYCDDLAKAVGVLASSIDKAIGGDGNNVDKMAREKAYYRLDGEFREWVRGVNPEDDLVKHNAYIQNWRETAKSIIYTLGRELVEQAGCTAISGRKVKEKDKGKKEVEKLYNAPKAFNNFIYKLNHIYEK